MLERIAIRPPMAFDAAGLVLGTTRGSPEFTPSDVTDPPKVTEPPAEENEKLSDFCRRYLSISGGRLGHTTTRQQLRQENSRRSKNLRI